MRLGDICDGVFAVVEQLPVVFEIKGFREQTSHSDNGHRVFIRHAKDVL
jgi:hypothetical protein